MSVRISTRSGYDLRRLTVGQALADKADKNGDKIFLTYLPDGRSFSYRDVDLITNRLANGLLRHGVSPRSHVAVMMENAPEHLFSYFALGKIGAVAVPINTAARGELLRYYLAHSDASAVIVDAHLLDRVAEILPSVPALRTVITLPSGGQEDPPTLHGADVLDYRTVADGPQGPPGVEVRFSDLATILYTSGTTGRSKGVMLTQVRNLLWGLGHVEALGYRHTDVLYVCLPLFHVNAFQGSTYTALMSDASIVLQRRFSATRFWSDIRQHRATAANMLGSMVNILWKMPPRPDDSEHHLRMCYAAPVPSFAEAFEARFGVRFTSGFGMTDFGTTHAYTLVDPVSKLGSCGRPRRGIEARIVDEDDFDVPTGQSGELLLRSNNVWDGYGGYYKMPDVTLASLRNGWFHTGDIGYIDADGYLWFTDRKKDVIRRRGENISAFEIEEIAMRHPAVAEAVAYPVASPLGEEEVAVSIVRRDGQSLSEAEFIDYCAANMAYFMVPRFVVITDELPRNLSLKVEKYKLRQEAERDLSALWDRERAGIVIAR